MIHVGDQGLEVAAQGLDGVVDEGLFAGELFQRRIEVALAEFGDAGHGLLLHRDMARDHGVDAGGHGGEVVLVFFNRDRDVDVALVMLGRHVIHVGDQGLEVVLQGFQSVAHGVLFGQSLDRHREVAPADLLSN